MTKEPHATSAEFEFIKHREAKVSGLTKLAINQEDRITILESTQWSDSNNTIRTGYDSY